MSDHEFSRKPHRMTSPPANEGLWITGYDGTKCRMETDPVRIAVLCREATWGSVYDFEPTPEIIESTLKEIAGGKVLGAAFEVPAIAFVMRGSRVTMDQLLRLRESAGAAHTTRDNDFRDFNIIVPNTIDDLQYNEDEMTLYPYNFHARCREHIRQARKLYGDLVDAGIPPQDARYIALPMGYQGDWIQVMNMRALIKECEHRLCNGLVQHETNYMARLQRDLVVAEWPHMDGLLRSRCEKNGRCTRGTMLFPSCGAFDTTDPDGQPTFGEPEMSAMELSVTYYDPERHLYSPVQNDAMQFAEWDRTRKVLERQFPDHEPYLFSVPIRIP